ncbi:MAG: hypothetical protein E7667_04890 [Ruminococcaceae bacterium]|nr:hypothetical protein [Oscillospiraceae bacterium]
MKTRKNLFKLLALAVMLTVMIGTLAVLSISAGAEGEDTPVIWTLDINESNYTVVDDSVNCTSMYDDFPYVLKNQGEYLDYYMYGGENSADNIGQLSVSLIANDAVVLEAGVEYTVHAEYSTGWTYDKLQSATLGIDIVDGTGTAVSIGSFSINSDTDNEPTTLTATVVPDADVTGKLRLRLSGELVDNMYGFSLYSVALIEEHEHDYNYVAVDSNTCHEICAFCQTVKENSEREHSLVDHVCEYCGETQLIRVQNGETEELFGSWLEMIEYINQNDGCTVTLIGDVAVDSEKWIISNLTVDLAGYKLSNFSAKSSGEIQVRFIDSSEGKTGEILRTVGVYSFTAYDNSTMVIDDIKTDGSFCINWGGSIIINNLVATSSSTNFSIGEGSMEVNGGEYGKFYMSISSDYNEESSISVKNITCTEYEISENFGLGLTIEDTLADGYALVDPEGNFFDVNQTYIRGEISAIEHTHEYDSYSHNETEHWISCICGKTQADTVAEAHTGGEATCISPAICEICGAEYGDLIPHEGGAATCTSPAICEICGAEYGDLLPHDGGAATCTAPAICDVCGQEYGDLLPHEGGEATCTVPAICDVCGQEYGSPLGHQRNEELICTVCGATPPVEVIVGDVSQKYETLAEALNAAAGLENAIVKLWADITGETGVYLYGNNVVLDLNGYAITEVMIDIYESSHVICDTSEQGEGSFNGTIYVSGGGLTVESGIIEGTIILYPEYELPSVTVNGGYFTEMSGILSYGGALVINGGEFEYGVFGIADVGAYPTQIGIVGGKFIQGIALESASGTLTLSDILSVGSCISYIDADGNTVEIDMASNIYNGYFEIGHSGVYGEYKTDVYAHWRECESCGAVSDYEMHSGGEATCVELAVCEICRSEYGYLADHIGGEATCTEKAVCENCGNEYGMTLPHDYGDGEICVDCGTGFPIKVIVGEEEFLYNDMYEALQKAAEYEFAMIVLQGHVSYPEEIIIPVNGNIGFDFAGYTVYNVNFSVYGKLTVDDSSENGEGGVHTDYAFDVYPGGSLTINGGNIDASTQISGSETDKAEFIINGGRFTGRYGVDVYQYSELYINGGEFDCDDEEIYISEGAQELSTVVLSGGVFPNGLMVVGGNVYNVLTETECLVYIDEDGYAIDVETLDVYYYENYIAVGHDVSLLEWVSDENTHALSCTVCDYEGEAEEHIANDPTCTEASVCEVCGKELEAALGHTWVDADCTTPKTCSVCKVTEGEALGHTWADADCTTPKTCSVCKVTEGEALGHTWADADCTTPKTCSVCKATEGEALGHKYDGETDAECNACGEIREVTIPEDPTKEPGEPNEETPTKAPNSAAGGEKEKKGCKSAVGISLISLTTAIAAGFVLTKKRK